MPKFDATSLANDELEAPEEKECDFCGEKPSIEYLAWISHSTSASTALRL